MRSFSLTAHKDRVLYFSQAQKAITFDDIRQIYFS